MSLGSVAAFKDLSRPWMAISVARGKLTRRNHLSSSSLLQSLGSPFGSDSAGNKEFELEPPQMDQAVAAPTATVNATSSGRPVRCNALSMGVGIFSKCVYMKRDVLGQSISEQGIGS